jgi:ligand-binding sensor domain-containing protein
MEFAFAGIELYSPDPLGVFYSTDNGTNWSPFNSGLTNKIIIALTIDGSGYVYAGTEGNGVFRTIKSTTTQ